MTTLVLQAAGSAIGGAIGGPFGAIAGQVVGAAVGSYVDNALFGRGGRHVEGPRLTDLSGVSASEGAPIPRVYGRARVGGQIIWATRLEEAATMKKQGSSGGKGAGGGSTTTYSYFVNLAVGLCEGPIAAVRRVWADGKELDLAGVQMRLHRGLETQEPDSLILAKEGGPAPAYRGLAYVVFERLPLDAYGARVPQFSFEVIAPISDLAANLRGVAIIPGASEFAYAPSQVTAQMELGVVASQNRHQLQRSADWSASIDNLTSVCPKAKSAALVVSWFGDDLRAGRCSIAPRAEAAIKDTIEQAWSVAGLSRQAARIVSTHEGRAAYGGSPSDASVRAAIADLKARGLSVVFYPFVMMDVPAGNALPDPYGGSEQAAYPWRGRITCDPAPGRVGSPDGRTGASEQIAAFFGSPEPQEDEWSYRRMILHYARLCAEAGGVDAFLIGSELIGLTRVRSASGVYPAVAELARLAADVKAILGADCKIGYSADWSEYGAHVLPNDEVRFPLDAAFGSPHVDFVGLDAYWPLADWRDGRDHLDLAEARSVYDREYLARRLAAGEDFDWWYPSDAARKAQTRAPIVDGAYGEHWIYRAKDLVGWWSNAHHERVDGQRRSAPTAWVPQSKPIWLIEVGCPAVDRGANQPNVFPDAKSSEAARPVFSRGERDDLMLIAALEAIIGRFDPDSPLFEPAGDPVSSVYGGRMIDPARVHAWAWDARPFPAFPLQSQAWGDAANWEKGHWLNGRVESCPLDKLVARIALDFGLPPERLGTVELDGHVDGYVVERPMSARAALEPLLSLFGADAWARGGRVGFSQRARPNIVEIARDELIASNDGALYEATRAQESELPQAATLTYVEGEIDFRKRAASSRRLESASRRESRNDVAAVMQDGEARRRLDVLLAEIWAGRESVTFELPPSRVAIEPGDVLRLPMVDAVRDLRVERVADGATRRIEARTVDLDLYDAPRGEETRASLANPAIAARPRVEVLDLALDRDGQNVLSWAAAFADPWPGSVTLWRETASGFEAQATIARSAVIGATLDPLPPGPRWRRDRASAVRVRMRGGALQSTSTQAMLAGANRLAVRGPDGAWEILGFETAELTADRIWRLSGLLRGLGGEEAAAERLAPAGSTVVLLDDAVTALEIGVSRLAMPSTWRAVSAGRDPSDPLAAEFVAASGPKALTPYAPVRPRARREASGVRLSFIRRARRDADSWEQADPPLAEDREAYRIELFDGLVVKRVVDVFAPELLYATADEVADFGASQTALSLRLRQISSVVGPGFAWSGIVPVL